MMTAAFKVELNYYEHKDGTYRGRVGAVQIPADLAPEIAGVFGLDNRPQARTHFRRLDDQAEIRANTTSYTPPQIAQLYNFHNLLETIKSNGKVAIGFAPMLFDCNGFLFNDRDIDAKSFFDSMVGVKIPSTIFFTSV